VRIVIDTREQAPFDFEDMDCEVVTAALPTGDYSLCALEDKIAIERKSLTDLVGCLTGSNRDRFERELSRARGLDYFAVVVEAAFGDLSAKAYHGGMAPHAAAQSILAFQVRYRTHFIWAGTRPAAKYVTFWLLSKFLRESKLRYENILKLHGAES